MRSIHAVMSVQKRVQIKIQLLKLSMQKHEQQASVWAADVPFERQARRKGISAQKEQLVDPCVRMDQQVALCRPGGYGGVAAPVPFPNTAVKRPCAHGTSS